MNKLTFGLMLMAASAISAQGAITLTTAAPAGTKVKLLVNVLSATQPVSVDFGNGVQSKFTIDPNQMAYNRWIEGIVSGSYIEVSGQITEFQLSNAQLTGAEISDMPNLKDLDLSNNQMTSFELLSATPIEKLNLSHNNIENSPSINATLSLEKAGGTLQHLNLSYNTGLECLNMRDLPNVEYLTLNDCPDFASIFIAPPGSGHDKLGNINIANCTLSNFYPISMPNLRSLDLSNNVLMTVATDNPFELGDYPRLTSLSLGGNRQIDHVDLTKLPLLEKVWLNDCRIESIDISQCPELLTLNVANNQIKSLDFGNNQKIQTIYVNGNPIKEIPFESLDKLRFVNISNTDVARADLMKAYYLQEFIAAETKLEFVDFNGQQPGRMQKIDLRNNPGFTYESMAYTVKTLPQAKKSYNTNLFLEGSNAEHADIAYVTDQDMQWVCDVTGDGSAEFSQLAVTLDATDTGENKTGELDRLYPLMGLGLSYDLDIMQTEGGQFILAQWQPQYFQTVKSVMTTALKGVPMYVKAYPEEGKRFKSVTVNGKEIFSPWFIISEPSTIKVNFTGEESSISFNVQPGHDFTFLVNTADNNGTVWVDWGTGTRTEYPHQNKYQTGYSDLKGTRIDGSAAGSKITVYGDIAGIDVSGFGDAAEYFGLWDNHITGVDLTNCPDLKLFNAYWNPISTIDLSNNTQLEVLNLSYTNLSTLDLSHNNNIMWLEAYSDGWGEDGIAQLESIDISNMPMLQYLDIKNNLISSIDLSNAPYLTWCTLTGNMLTSLDVTNNPELLILKAAENQIASIDLSNNTKLTELNLDANKLNSVDVSNNTKLTDLMVADNYLDFIDLSALKGLQRVYINGNGMTAAQLNDIYYKLPVRVDDGSSNEMQVKNNLFLIQGLDREDNDAMGSDTSIAEYKGWLPTHQGTNANCDVAYLDIATPVNGTFRVLDAAGNEYTNGSKVTKYLPLTIVCEPAPGYEFKSLTLNGENTITTPAFDMPGIYTRLYVEFIKSTGIADVDGQPVRIAPAAGGINVEAPAAALSVYTTTGMTVISDRRIDGSEFIALNPGTYVVRLTGEGFVRTISVIVK